MKEIIELWKNYNIEKDKLNEIYKELRSKVSVMTIDDLDMFSYDELKLMYNLFIGTDAEKLYLSVYNEKRLEKYPQLKGVIYFDAINQIDFLSDEDKKALDTVLSYYKTGDFIRKGSKIYNKYKFIFTDEVLDKLCELGILTRVYVYKALCSCDDDFKNIEYVSQDVYDKMKYWLSLDKSKLSREEYERLEDENFVTLYLDCENYDCIEPELSFEVETLEDLEKYSCILYKVVGVANRKYDKL